MQLKSPEQVGLLARQKLIFFLLFSLLAAVPDSIGAAMVTLLITASYINEILDTMDSVVQKHTIT